MLEQQLQLVLRERQSQVRARLLEVAARDAAVAVEVELGERAFQVERAAADAARLADALAIDFRPWKQAHMKR